MTTCKSKFCIDNDKVVGFSKLKNFINANLIDLRNSHSFRKSHIIKSRWSTRANLRFVKIKQNRDILIIYDDIVKAQLATKTISKKFKVNIYYHNFDEKGIQTYPELYTISPYYPKTKDCVDYIYHTHKRHDGNKTHSKAYLAWEKNLLKRMDGQELKKFIKL